jgi:hypothetical protein
MEETDLVGLDDLACRHVQAHPVEMSMQRVAHQLSRDRIRIDWCGRQFPVSVMNCAQSTNRIQPTNVDRLAGEDLHGGLVVLVGGGGQQILQVCRCLE